MNQNTLILTVLDTYWRRTLIRLEPVVILFAALIMIAPFPLLSDPRPVINATTGGLIAALSLILVSLNLFSGRFKSLPDELSKLQDLLHEAYKMVPTEADKSLRNPPGISSVRPTLDEILELFVYATLFKKFARKLERKHRPNGGQVDENQLQVVKRMINLSNMVEERLGEIYWFAELRESIQFLIIVTSVAISSGILILFSWDNPDLAPLFYAKIVLILPYRVTLMASLIGLPLLVFRAAKYLMTTSTMISKINNEYCSHSAV
jgi:hypothetical protein